MVHRKRRSRYYSTSYKRQRRRLDTYTPPELNLSPDTKRGIGVVLFLAVGAVASLSLADIAGKFGETADQILRLLFGSLALVSPIIFFGIAFSLLLGGRKKSSKDESDRDVMTSTTRTYVGSTLFVLGLTGLLHTLALQKETATAFELVREGQGGGYLGIFTSFPLYSLMGYIASMVVLSAILAISFLITFNISLHRALHGLLKLITLPFRGSDNLEPAKPAALPQQPAAVQRAEEPVKINTMQSMGFAVNNVNPKPKAETDAETEVKNPAALRAVKTAEAAAGPTLDIVAKHLTKEEWKLPPTDLLEETTATVQSGGIEANVKIIKKTLEDFGITADMGEVNVGPTVTQYTLRPAVGVKLASVVSLKDNLALALAASSLRIEAPIPGKSLVGIEVPNANPATVRLRELIESDDFKDAPSNLTFALGRDVAGHPMIADLEKMPHLLVAGATGTGKSVCVNAVLTSFLYRNSPDELRFVIIDPKRVELQMYNNIPHLLTPVVTDSKAAINALKWSVSEMDRRYTLLSEAGNRNIQEYNAHGSHPRMPYIIVVVDELAQLMSLAKADVETAIVRLAQMARAVGIHLLLATQRPSVDVVTGLIKANITSRIAFAVKSQVDSRTILDISGAESLMGRGDMLYTTPELPKPKRMQGPFLSTKELGRVIDFIKEQSGPVTYQEEIIEKPKAGTGMSISNGDDMDDEMIEAAIDEIRRARKASASLLQRRLKLGYARAARILDILEERGMIGPAEGAKPRDIYLDDGGGMQ